MRNRLIISSHIESILLHISQVFFKKVLNFCLSEMYFTICG